jgi:hypothetical protein
LSTVIYVQVALWTGNNTTSNASASSFLVIPLAILRICFLSSTNAVDGQELYINHYCAQQATFDSRAVAISVRCQYVQSLAVIANVPCRQWRPQSVAPRLSISAAAGDTAAEWHTYGTFLTTELLTQLLTGPAQAVNNSLVLDTVSPRNRTKAANVRDTRSIPFRRLGAHTHPWSQRASSRGT